MNIEDIKNIKTRAEARQFAIDWQSWMDGRVMGWGDAAEWAKEFEYLANEFGLVEEFKENGII